MQGRNNNGPETLPCGTPDTTLTSLLRQPSTILWCYRFDKNCVNIDNTELPHDTELPQYPQNWAYIECPDSWPYRRLHWNQSSWSQPPAHSPLRFAVYGTRTKAIIGILSFQIRKLGFWKHTTAFHKSSKTNRNQELKHLTKYYVMEIGRQLASE